MGQIILQSLSVDELKELIKNVLAENMSIAQIPKIKDEANLLTRTEVAKLLRISLPTLHDWTKTGIIQAYRIGRRVLYKSSEVNQSLHSIISNKYKK